MPLTGLRTLFFVFFQLARVRDQKKIDEAKQYDVQTADYERGEPLLIARISPRMRSWSGVDFSAVAVFD